MPRFGFRVGDLSVAVAGPGPFRDRGRFAPRDPPALRLRARYASEPLRPARAPVVECDTWAAFADGDRISLLSHIQSLSPPELARVDLERGSREGSLLMRPGLPEDPLEYPLDQLLVIHLLHELGGLLLHAACLVQGGRAFVVAGPSGAGKTTISRAAASLPRVTVLTDERIVLRRDGGRWLAHGTPWAGEGRFADPGSAEVAGVFLLDKSDVDRVTPLSPVRAMAGLLRCHFPAGWTDDASAQLRGLEDLVAMVPCYRLQTRRGGNAHRLATSGSASDCDRLRVRARRGALIAGLLRDERPTRFTAFGTSMLPAICPGDSITVEPISASQARVGDVVLFDSRGYLVAHRVVSRAPLTTRGDALPLPDPHIEADDVLGRVTRVEGSLRRRLVARTRWQLSKMVRSAIDRVGLR